MTTYGNELFMNPSEIRAKIAELRGQLKSTETVDLQKVGEKIKSARETHGWTQSDLADFTSVGRTQITMIETGRSNLTVRNLYSICKSLGLSADKLIGLDS